MYLGSYLFCFFLDQPLPQNASFFWFQKTYKIVLVVPNLVWIVLLHVNWRGLRFPSCQGPTDQKSGKRNHPRLKAHLMGGGEGMGGMVERIIP